eukprot:5277546-Karenia_brevis.AAC.1
MRASTSSGLNDSQQFVYKLDRGDVATCTLPKVREVAKGCGPRRALSRLKFSQKEEGDKVLWLHQARLEAVLGGMRMTIASWRSGVRCYFAFVDDVYPGRGVFFPPSVEILLGRACCFEAVGPSAII